MKATLLSNGQTIDLESADLRAVADAVRWPVQVRAAFSAGRRTVLVRNPEELTLTVLKALVRSPISECLVSSEKK